MSWLTAENLELVVDRCADNDTVRRAFLGVYPHNRLPPPILPSPEQQQQQHKLSRRYTSSPRMCTTTNTVVLPQPPLTLIVNTDTHNLPGRHWTSVYIDRNRRGELFDSLVTPPSAHLTRFMNRHCHQWSRNRLVYQHPYSSHCGVYVLLHVLYRYKYNTLKQFCEANFTSSLLSNECFVRAFYKQHLHSLITPFTIPPPSSSTTRTAAAAATIARRQCTSRSPKGRR